MIENDAAAVKIESGNTDAVHCNGERIVDDDDVPEDVTWSVVPINPEIDQEQTTSGRGMRRIPARMSRALRF